MFRLAEGFELLLASGSPRRKELLASLGLPFSVVRPCGEEPKPLPGEAPVAFAERCARAKACEAGAHYVTISADTIVCIGNQIYGKPRDSADSLRMLQNLNGNTHLVVTGYCVILPRGHSFCHSCCSSVHFHTWPQAVIEAYAKSGEPLDKAGAYAVQGEGAFLIDRIEGSWTNVMGLPMSELVCDLLSAGAILPA